MAPQDKFNQRKFIELDRCFCDVEEISDGEEAAYSSYLGLIGQDDCLDWDTVLKSRITVILGEPGSGKTWELRNRTTVLRDTGTLAFFVHLDRLITETLERAMSPEDVPAFQRWRKHRRNAVFLLDSVDEAKILKQSDFGKALDGFVHGIGMSRLPFVNLVVSSRISDWRAQTDKDELLGKFRIPKEDEDAPQESGAATPLFRIVQIQPLDAKRVRIFAEGVGLQDSSAFINALDLHHAWDFARRPIDVAGLIDYWRERGRLGTLSELIEFDLDKRLRETEERSQNDPLTTQQAREGAQALGAAVIFCKRFNFTVPDSIPAKSDGVAMDARDSLPLEWKPLLCQGMLARALFDSASYGRIRFHHRRTAEYLAAEWLRERMRQGCPYPVLEDLLFSQRSAPWLIRPGLRPVVAWLALGEEPWAKHMRQRILSNAPDLFFTQGDAEPLPLEYKRSLLQSMIARYPDRNRICLDTDVAALSRLSDSRLAPDINEILNNPAIPSRIRILLLEIVRHGRLSGCLDTAVAIVASPTESEDIKSYAVAAIRDLGDQASRLRLAKVATALNSVNHHLCSLFIQALYPQAIDAQGVAELLRKARYDNTHSTSMSWALKRHLEDHLPDDQAAKLLSGLLKLCQEPPHIDHARRETPLSVGFVWLCEVIPVPLIRMLRHPLLNDREVETAGEALWLLSHFQQYDRIDEAVTKEISVPLAKHPSVRRSFMLRTVDQWERNGNLHKLRSYDIFEPRGIVQEGEDDIDWLIPEIAAVQPRPIRIIALRVAIGVWRSQGRKQNIWRRLIKAVGDDPELRSLLKVEATKGLLPWLRSLWYRYWDLRLRRKAKNVPRRLRESYRNARYKIWLFWNINKLRNGTALRALTGLTQEASEGSHSNRWGVESLDPLIAKRGTRIALAAAKGWNAVWRLFDPPLPFEKSDAHQHDSRVVIGLSGINIALANEDLKFESFTEEEARRACSYALNELNGFADWLPELARYHPNSVREVLSRCIRGEWATPSEAEHRAKTLSDLRYYGKALAPLVAEVILDELRVSDPKNYRVLEYALSILLGLPKPPKEQISNLAARRAPAYTSHKSHFFSLWMAVWLQLDANSALRYLLDALTITKDATDIVIKICGALSPHHHGGCPMIAEPDYGRPGFLQNFIPFVFEYVREEDDINRSGGGPYSPVARDDAQDFRNALFQRLANHPGREAGIVLLELAEEPRFTRYRDWILQLYQQHAETDADLTPWLPTDVRLFARDFETEPRSDHDLFKIAFTRLKQIKDDVERGEISSRYDLHPDDDEPRLRSWLARRLRELSRTRYTVPQEEEIDQRQRPDLRIEAPGVRPISIELKWADNWSLVELTHGLVDQLAGQYLRAPDNNYGIYVVGYKGLKKRWQAQECGSNLDFPALLLHLQEKADAFIKHRFDIDGLSVVGIDFSQPKETR